MPEHKTIYEAMLAVQSELTNPIKSATNPHFKSKYATLPDIRDMITPILAKHGLYCIQPVQTGDMGAYLETNIIFAPTGEKAVSIMPLMLDKQTAQGMGSAITYARRYALCAILNIAADDDDDGNAASQPKPEQKGMPGRMADDKDVQDDLKASGYDAKAVYDTVMYELNACDDSDMLADWVKVNKTTRRMQGLPSDLKDDVTSSYNKLKQHFADKGV